MFTLAWRKGWAAVWVRCSVFASGGINAAANEPAAWDRVRNGRFAPRRFEVEPAKIAALLPETFIAEGAGLLGCRFRLAATKVCEQFGRELRGADPLS